MSEAGFQPNDVSYNCRLSLQNRDAWCSALCPFSFLYYFIPEAF